MYFSKWNELNQELIGVCKEIQENLINDWNFEDTSVGCYSIGELNEYVINDLNENYDECKIKKWEKEKCIIEVSEIYLLTLEIVERGYDDFGWEITNARKKYSWEMKK